MSQVAMHPLPNALLAFQGGEAGVVERRAIEEHLKTCSECRTSLALLEDTVTSLQSWAEEDPPADGLERVLAEVRRTRPAAAPRRDWLWPVLASLLGVAAGSVIIYGTGVRLFQWLRVVDLRLLAPVGPLSGFGLAALVFFGIGSLFTLVLAPVLLLEMQSRERRLAAR